MFNPKQTRKIAAVIILVVIVAMVATSIIPYIIYNQEDFFEGGTKEKERVK